MKRIFVYAIAAVAVVLLAVCLFRYAGWGRESEKEDEGLNGFIDAVTIGETTFEEVYAMDPDMLAVYTSYGYFSVHELENGGSASIKFYYDIDTGSCIVREIHINEP